MLYDKEKIHALMLDRGLSGNELGRLAKISGPSMHAILKGTTKNVRAQTMIGIANALGVPLRQILKVKMGKSDPDAMTDAIELFSTLDERNKMAMIAAMRSLAAQQKK